MQFKVYSHKEGVLSTDLIILCYKYTLFQEGFNTSYTSYQHFIITFYNFVPEVIKNSMDRVFQLTPCDPIIFRLTPLSHSVCVEVIGGGTKNLG